MRKFIYAGIGAFFAVILLIGYTASAATIPGGEALFETSLQDRIVSTDTSMTVVANSLRGGGVLTGYHCFTVDEGRSDSEYICGSISGTSVTSLTRGVSFVTGTTSVTALQSAHRKGANVKITDYPLINILANILNGVDRIPNIINYTYDKDFSTASTSAIATIGFVQKTAFGSTPVGVTAGGTGLTSVPAYTYLSGNGTGALIATSSPTFGFITATSSAATSTFNGAVSVRGLSVTDNTVIGGSITVTGSATFNGGIAGATYAITGSGVDGPQTYSATTTLTQDLYAQNVTVNQGVTLYTGGYRIFATGTVSVLGNIKNDGGNGKQGTSGVGVAGGIGGLAASSTSMGTSTAGATGGASNGAGVSAASIANAKGGSGGAGGSSSGGAAGSAGTATATAARLLDLVSFSFLQSYSTSTSQFLAINGGAGGGGGGGGSGNTGSGGGGGGGGGVVQIIANIISVGAAGSITANGGTGAAGNSANQAGGGGGGGGGLVALGYLTSYTNSGTVQASGGAGGAAAAGGGGAGTAGSSGAVVTLQIK